MAAKQPQRLPTVLTVDEIKSLLPLLEGAAWLITSLLYDSGLRILEACRLRVQDVDFTVHQLVVRNGKGAKDRMTMLPATLIDPLRSHLELVRLQHERDCFQGHGDVYLPFALDRKYPNAAKEWKWQYVFPAGRFSRDPRSGAVRRHHIEEQLIQRAVHKASVDANINKRVTPHTFAAHFATHLLMGGYDIRTVQELPGHQDFRTTMKMS